MKPYDWHLITAKTTPDASVFEDDEGTEITISTQLATVEPAARAIASEIRSQQDIYFARGQESGRATLANDLRDLINAAADTSRETV